jgi:hypothetical protein
MHINELLNGIKSGEIWHTGMMSKDQIDNYAFINNFKQLTFMTITQVQKLMDDNGIVAFAGEYKNVDPTYKVHGTPVFDSYIPLSQEVLDIINTKSELT